MDLLTFNEPDSVRQANMTVAQAVSLWSQVEAYGCRLGSPETQGALTGRGGTWMKNIMAQMGNRVGFVSLHCYFADQNIVAFRNYLQPVYDYYKKPIWITEWGLVDFTNPARYSLSDMAAFANQALPMLDSLPFVERHAWFSGSHSKSIKSGMLDKNGNLTEIGQVFKAQLALLWT